MPSLAMQLTLANGMWVEKIWGISEQKLWKPVCGPAILPSITDSQDGLLSGWAQDGLFLKESDEEQSSIREQGTELWLQPLEYQGVCYFSIAILQNEWKKE